MAEMTGEGELLKASLGGSREAFGTVVQRDHCGIVTLFLVLRRRRPS